MRHFWDTVTSRAYWGYVLFSKTGAESLFAIFGLFYLLIEVFDFFKIYTRDQYASYAVFILLSVSLIISVAIRRPIRSVAISLPENDCSIEVRIEDLFDVGGAIMISTNTQFESDVAGGKIAIDSLQGQFTAKYFTGNQNELIDQIRAGLKDLPGQSPYPMGTTIPITTHGKTFYLTAMSELNEKGNASSSIEDVKVALGGLWAHVREAGELQELGVPLVGTGRGRLKMRRKKMIALIAESFADASKSGKLTDRLVIVARPEDASRFAINLYDVKDHLEQALVR